MSSKRSTIHGASPFGDWLHAASAIAVKDIDTIFFMSFGFYRTKIVQAESNAKFIWTLPRRSLSKPEWSSPVKIVQAESKNKLVCILPRRSGLKKPDLRATGRITSRTRIRATANSKTRLLDGSFITAVAPVATIVLSETAAIFYFCINGCHAKVNPFTKTRT